MPADPGLGPSLARPSGEQPLRKTGVCLNRTLGLREHCDEVKLAGGACAHYTRPPGDRAHNRPGHCKAEFLESSATR